MTEYKVTTESGACKTFVRENDAMTFWRYLKRVGIAATLAVAVVTTGAHAVERRQPQRAPYVFGYVVPPTPSTASEARARNFLDRLDCYKGRHGCWQRRH